MQKRWKKDACTSRLKCKGLWFLHTRVHPGYGFKIKMCLIHSSIIWCQLSPQLQSNVLCHDFAYETIQNCCDVFSVDALLSVVNIVFFCIASFPCFNGKHPFWHVLSMTCRYIEHKYLICYVHAYSSGWYFNAQWFFNPRAAGGHKVAHPLRFVLYLRNLMS